MIELPSYIQKKHLTYWWLYLDANLEPFAISLRYDEPGRKKRFHQYQLDASGNWVEGAPTPLPLFGIHTLPKSDYDGFVGIFEGERCAQAAHSLHLPAITSMMGSSQGHLADWSSLAAFRHLKKFVVFPDNDDPGERYARLVIAEIKKACPQAEILVCHLPNLKKGEDLIDWLVTHEHMQPGWDDFAPIDEPYSVYLRQAFEACVKDQSIAAETYLGKCLSCPINFESDPETIKEELSPVLPCPIDTFPPVVRQWMIEIADQMQIPIDYLAAPFLVFAGSVIGRKRGLLMRPGSDWIEYPNLWGMIIGRPSLMKSPAMSAMLAPLNALAEKALQNFSKEISEYKKKLDYWKIRKKAADEVYKKGIKDSLENNTNAINTHPPFLDEEPKEPVRKRYKTDDPTVEKLGELLIENPQGLLLFRDELNGWFQSFLKIGRENDRQFYLESWSGKKDFDIDRISRGSLHVPALMISIFGSIQPGPLSQYVRSAIKGGNGDDGFFQRVQVLVYPDVCSEFKVVSTQLSEESANQVNRCFEFLDSLTFDSNGGSVILQFDQEAQALFDSWQLMLENRLRRDGLPAHLEAHFAKYKKLLGAICLILEHLETPNEGPTPSIIRMTTLKKAIQLIDYFESHSYRVYGSSINAIPKAARELVTRIKKEEIQNPFTAREVYHKHHWSGMTNADEVEEVLDYLIEAGYLVSANVQTNGRPTRKYWVHPKIFEED